MSKTMYLSYESGLFGFSRLYFVSIHFSTMMNFHYLLLNKTSLCIYAKLHLSFPLMIEPWFHFLDIINTVAINMDE